MSLPSIEATADLFAAVREALQAEPEVDQALLASVNALESLIGLWSTHTAEMTELLVRAQAVNARQAEELAELAQEHADLRDRVRRAEAAEIRARVTR